MTQYKFKNNTLVKMNKLEIYWDKFKHFFTKWKLINSDSYTLLKFPHPTRIFILSEKQQKQVDEIYKTQGGMDYIFYFTEIGIGFKVKIWKTNEYIDLTDYDTW